MSVKTVTRAQTIQVLRDAAREVDNLTYARIGRVSAGTILRSVAPDWYAAEAALVVLIDHLGDDADWLSTWTQVTSTTEAARLMREAADQLEATTPSYRGGPCLGADEDTYRDEQGDYELDGAA
ncbi:hypothetical protein [Nonomuraea sp. NPDC050310]|uniref:hypothetical protein n=1 Tax=Nonomuraea sp. NPDC050310 TaxID=3154935 RepID=UPI0033F66562